MLRASLSARNAVSLVFWLVSIPCLIASAAFAQSTPKPPVSLSASPAQSPASDCPETAGALYDRLRSVTLDPKRVYHIRDASLDRPNLQLDFDDGTIAFTEDICGRITGAMFEGEGEIRVRSPNRAERASLALFTSMAILEEQFTSGYLRFNDDTARLLQPFLTSSADSADFLQSSSDVARTLAEFDAMRLFADFSHFLPSADPPSAGQPSADSVPQPQFPDLFHAHLLGRRLGAFEVFWDATSSEPLSIAQARTRDDILFFDIWTSFAPANLQEPAAGSLAGVISIESFRIQATVDPPTQLHATTDVRIQIHKGGERTVIFELSRFLKIHSVVEDDRPLDFIQNPSIEGSALRRKGNDLVAVVFPAPLPANRDLTLRFTYTGDVLSDAGNGLLYVGERGNWYPNFGLNPAQFDMEFRYPANWTLVATGNESSRSSSETGQTNSEATGEKVSRFVTERPIPVAGFDLGKYVWADAKAGNINVAAFATKGVEKSFPRARSEIVVPTLPGRHPRSAGPIVVTGPAPSPAHDVQSVANRAARAITTFSDWFGPYPYHSLSLTQMPGDLSQGWPSLVFLSSFAFLSPQEQSDLRLDPVTRDLDTQVLVHETAHQWWGDLVLWKDYRDQWIAEGLANYASLLVLEQEDPAKFHQVLEKYRHDLLSKNKDGEWLRDAGPVTFGARLDSSHFPDGYEQISYERGAWLFHMLRSMLRDSESASHSRNRHAADVISPDEPFFRALRKIRDRYAGKTISTEEMIQVFEEQLPKPLWYEKRPKLDWFLDGWINGTAIPSLTTKDLHFADKPASTTITGVIVQKDAPEDLVTAVPVYAITTTNAEIFLGEVLADGAESAFHLTAPSGIRKIVLDPYQTILTAPK
jgi:hypothetical protein